MNGKKGKRRRRAWKYTAGRKPHRVTVRERWDGGCNGNIFGAIWDPERGRYVRRSLGHRSKERAIAWADKQAVKLRDGRSALQQNEVTLRGVLEEYLRHKTPSKTPKGQRDDHRRAEFWNRALGSDTNPNRIALRDWEQVIRNRGTGRLNARGHLVGEGDRRAVRARTVEAACNWLRWVLSWATEWESDSGQYLMHRNPLVGRRFRQAVPRELNPRRPVASQDRLEALLAVADRVTMAVPVPGQQPRTERSHLRALLILANGTGRRLSPICALRFEDLLLGDGTPYGSIRWPADTDKSGYESTVPIGPEVRAAIDRIMRERPGIGSAPLFPSPSDPARPIDRYLAGKWLRRAERLAGLEPQRGSLWHAFRRKWATERKGMPVQDVARAGGWRTASVVQDMYQQADTESTLRVVLGGSELRDVK